MDGRDVWTSLYDRGVSAQISCLNPPKQISDHLRRPKEGEGGWVSTNVRSLAFWLLLLRASLKVFVTWFDASSGFFCPPSHRQTYFTHQQHLCSKVNVNSQYFIVSKRLNYTKISKKISNWCCKGRLAFIPLLVTTFLFQAWEVNFLFETYQSNQD